jgi:hypothetical protein
MEEVVLMLMNVKTIPGYAMVENVQTHLEVMHVFVLRDFYQLLTELHVKVCIAFIYKNSKIIIYGYLLFWIKFIFTSIE